MDHAEQVEVQDDNENDPHCQPPTTLRPSQPRLDLAQLSNDRPGGLRGAEPLDPLAR